MNYEKLIETLNAFKEGSIDINQAIELIRTYADVDLKQPMPKSKKKKSKKEQKEDACAHCRY